MQQRLSDDELEIIARGVAHPLEPQAAVRMSSTCIELRARLPQLLQVLKTQYEEAEKLIPLPECKSRAELRVAASLNLEPSGRRGHDRLAKAAQVTAALEAFCMLARANALQHLKVLTLYCRLNLPAQDEPELLDSIVHVLPLLALSLDAGALPSVKLINLGHVHNAQSAAAFVSILDKGAFPSLKTLDFSHWTREAAAGSTLSAILNARPAMENLFLSCTSLHDDGLAAIVGRVRPSLKRIYLDNNELTDVGMDSLASALNEGRLPALEKAFTVGNWRISSIARDRVSKALEFVKGVRAGA